GGRVMSETIQNIVRKPKPRNKKKAGTFASSNNAPNRSAEEANSWGVLPVETKMETKPEDIDSIAESTSPPFFFSAFIGQRMAFSMKNGDTICGTVRIQRWQY